MGFRSLNSSAIFLILFVVVVHCEAANIPPEALPAAATPIVLRTGGSARDINLRTLFRDPDVLGSVVRVSARIGSTTKTVDIALLDQEKPITVTNFLNYVTSGRYVNNFFHRSVPGFVVQGGGFRWITGTAGDDVDSVQAFPTIQNEPGISNVRGTIAMAKLGGDPNSASSQWFINMANNSANLDSQNGGFTVFGRVVGNGMTVMDEIIALPRVNAGSPFDSLPVKDFSGNTVLRVHTVETNAQVLPGALNFAALSNNPTLVALTLDIGTMRLTPSATDTGTTTVPVTATDLDSESIQTPLTVQVLPRSAGIRIETGLGGAVTGFTREANDAQSLVDDQLSDPFGTREAGSAISRIYTFKNESAAPLTGIMITRLPSSSRDFSVTQQPQATLAPGAITSYTITFSSIVTAEHSAIFEIASTDLDQPSFRLLTSALAIDTTPPSINGIQPVTLVAGFGGTATMPDLRGTLVTATDNVGVVSFLQSPGPGTVLAPGTQSLTFTATDLAENTAMGETTVTVTFTNTAPTLAPISDPGALLEDAPLQTIGLSGISGGNGEVQTLTITAVSSNPDLIPHPAVVYSSPAATGSLTFTPVANQSGSTTITVTVKDDGGTANGGADTIARTFQVTVLPVNDTPTLGFISDPAPILEDAAQQTMPLGGISAGAAETQALTITAQSSNPALIPHPTVIYTSPANIGSLQFTPVSNASGTAIITVTVQDDGGTANGATDTITRTFQVSVTTVNDAPTLDAVGDPAAIAEDAAQQTIMLSGISAGPGETQSLTVTALSSNPALIPNPTVTYTSPANSGSLRFTPVANQSGNATITVTVKDNGGTTNGGVDTITRTFLVSVTAVNDPPTLSAIGNPIPISENAGQQTVSISGIGSGAGESQLLTVSAESSNIGLIPHPAVQYTSPATTGSLRFTPVPNQSGTATITVTVRDDGGTANGGVDVITRTFTVTVNPVNTPPLFVKGPDVAVAQDAGAQTIPNWATGISPGVNETGQDVEFFVTAETPGLFTTAPSITPEGTLAFTPAPTASGSTNVTVFLRDNGSTANGGQNQSASQTFQIAVTTFTEEIGSYYGLVSAATGTALSHSRAGSCRVVLSKGGKFTARLSAGAFTFSVRGVVDKGGVARFGRLNEPTITMVRKNLAPLTLSLTLDVGQDSGKLRGSILENGAAFAQVQCDRALYTTKTPAVPPLLNLPTGLIGKYTAIFQSLTPAEQNLPAENYPQGDGVATITLSKGGVAKISAKLADGTRGSFSGPLSKTNTYPLFFKLAGGQGSLSGFVTFRNQPGISDADGTDLVWFRPAAKPGAVGVYPAGWAAGVRVDLVASLYTVPPSNSASILPGLSANRPNAEIHLSGGELAATALTKDLFIASNNKVTVTSPGADRLALSFSKGTGMLSGSFIHPTTSRKVTITGAVLQKQAQATGYFIQGTRSGMIQLEPKPQTAP